MKQNHIGKILQEKINPKNLWKVVDQRTIDGFEKIYVERKLPNGYSVSAFSIFIKEDGTPEDSQFEFMPPFQINQNLSIHGTSFNKTTITIEPNVLIGIFGSTDGDGYKCANEWIFLGQDGKPYTLYDYKQTSLYDYSLPDPLSPMYLNSKIEFYIGSHGNKKMEEKLVEFIKQKIVEKN